jgi:hypothetical protein
MYQEPLFDEPESDDQPSFRQASRANPSQVRASVWELMTSVIYGPKSHEYLATRAPDGSWVKMSEGYSLFPAGECSEQFSETWPTWGTALDGVATVLTKPLEQAIGATECLSSDIWRTPSAGDPDGGIMEIREGADGKYKLRDDAPDFAKRFHQAQTTSTDGENSCESGPTSHPPSTQRKRLNYRFVQRLMGFPDDWF